LLLLLLLLLLHHSHLCCPVLGWWCNLASRRLPSCDGIVIAHWCSLVRLAALFAPMRDSRG
jgi:hypothetical protein